ncbi:MAG: SDR family NAD(P)-dependent oxidoreductase [bacterium]|nr:SDR family NAD(P)-dependent oxidoreductase [bacterium]
MGPAMIIPVEYPNIRCRSVDIVVPPAGSPKEQVLVDQLEAELNAGSSDNVAAYRNFYRLVRTYEPLPTAPAPKEVPHLKKGGVYLITGGTGGIGLEIAKHLSHLVGAELILTARSPFPPREEWPQWLDTHGPGDPMAVKIRKVMELEETGSRVLIVDADVSDHARMQNEIAAAEEQLGKINGVFHAAGVPGGGMIQLKTREKADEVLLPKVKGTLVLDSLLKDRQLDFFILCSSINSVLSMFGQVDYYAANAFLDAFAAAKRRDGTFSVSINWDTWQEVGIAVEAAKQWGRKSVVKDVNHPLFDQNIHEDAGQEIYMTRFDFDRHWVLSEHKVTESGKGLAPGVTYLEMAREAFEKHRNDGSVEISDVYFFKPMMVDVGEPREARFSLQKQDGNGSYDFLVRSRPGTETTGDADERGNWQTHAVGKIRSVDTGPDPKEVKHDIREIAAACSQKDIIVTDYRGSSPENLLVLGPRWLNLKRVQFGEREALATISLPETYHPELDVYKLHPALLDSAVAFFFPDSGKDAYIPFSYKRLTIKAALPSTFFSHCKIVEEKDGVHHGEFLKFDITIMDEQGVELVDIKEFTMLRVSEEVEEKIREKETSAAPGRFTAHLDSKVDKDKEKQEEFLKNGILPPEGLEVFERIMAGTLPQVVVSTTELSTRIKTVTAASPLLQRGGADETKPPAPTQPRPDINSVYVAPKTDTERKIAGIWQGLLGIQKVGIHDDFFELGGDSLNVVQLNNELKKILNKDIPVAVMFRYLTIHAFTQYLQLEEKGSNAPAVEEDRTDEIKKGKDRLKARMKRR